MKAGTLLKTKRIEAGLSQQQLADKLYIDRSMISRWESEKSHPNEQQFQQLCDVLNIPYDSFSDQNKPENTYISRITNEQIYSYIVLIVCSVIGLFVKPWGLPFAAFSIYYSFKKRMPLLFKLFSILVFLYCLDNLLFLFGIYIIRPKITID
ncbi:MAG: helix-turn-helix transcriptional regulator [Solobacterium sp.]|nr:helix-turn-helix transcriptional regulator [Solobacterium sp.]